ncbi:hypothetical protein SLEP1_g4006 [Rubroshorea leprosula]|uniref:Uncharacterized protein n=1 Tax=Rubroshorea leprosula TaxID=152421 RepID=A0AAV5HW11_9ROSI|nr:hypothetical protein SLEP1_g4006 [Rubroshorea leprosula]
MGQPDLILLGRPCPVVCGVIRLNMTLLIFYIFMKLLDI